MRDDNGHIYAPVSVDDVKGVLGAESYDVSTLCMDENINEYSMIRPVPTDYPDFQVSNMKKGLIGELMNAPYEPDISWERRLWGWQVPFVMGVDLFDKIKTEPWYRPLPKEDSYHCLNHFDGYKHDATYLFDWYLPEIEPGEKIIVSYNFGKRQSIISDSGEKNPGGDLSVLSVFEDMPFYFGVIILYSNGFNNVTHWEVSPTPITSTSAPMGFFQTSISTVSGRNYRVTPFITDKHSSGYWTAGAKLYSLCFSDKRWLASKDMNLAYKDIFVTVRAKEILANGDVNGLVIVIRNDTAYPYSVVQLDLTMREKLKSSKLGDDGYVEKYVYSLPVNESLAVPPQGQAIYEVDVLIRFYGGAATLYGDISGTAIATSRDSQGRPLGDAKQIIIPTIRIWNPAYYDVEQ